MVIASTDYLDAKHPLRSTKYEREFPGTGRMKHKFFNIALNIHIRQFTKSIEIIVTGYPYSGITH